jgi:hypothetical protein
MSRNRKFWVHMLVAVVVLLPAYAEITRLVLVSHLRLKHHAWIHTPIFPLPGDWRSINGPCMAILIRNQTDSTTLLLTSQTLQGEK